MRIKSLVWKLWASMGIFAMMGAEAWGTEPLRIGFAGAAEAPRPTHFLDCDVEAVRNEPIPAPTPVPMAPSRWGTEAGNGGTEAQNWGTGTQHVCRAITPAHTVGHGGPIANPSFYPARGSASVSHAATGAIWNVNVIGQDGWTIGISASHPDSGRTDFSAVVREKQPTQGTLNLRRQFMVAGGRAVVASRLTCWIVNKCGERSEPIRTRTGGTIYPSR